MSEGNYQIDGSVPHGMRDDDFVWWLAERDSFRPVRVVKVLSPTSMIVRKWRFTDWLSYALFRVGQWIKYKWWEIQDRLEAWMGG